MVQTQRVAQKRRWAGCTTRGGPRLALVLPLVSLAWSGAGLAAELTHHVALFPAASDWGEHDRQGFVRVVNRSDRDGDVRIDAFDDDGVNHGPITLAVGAGETAHFNSDDLERGNAAKGLTGAAGAGHSHWRLEMSSADLNIDVLAYVRTRSGFLTTMHDVATGPLGGILSIPTFNPASNTARQSLLRLTNPTAAAANVVVYGVDDDGNFSGDVLVALPAGASRTLTAQDLEAGKEDLSGSLGDGSGKWWLTVQSTVAIRAAGLLQATATGLLTNLSTALVTAFDASRHVPLFPSASDGLRQGFVRVANRYREDFELRIDVFDEDGVNHGPLTLSLGALESAHFNSEDLERGNPAKGLKGATGPGTGDWRLEVSGAEVDVLAYIRAGDGFLTAMHDVAPSEAGVQFVPTFNPGRNTEQLSLLRLTNLSAETASIVVGGVDDAGTPGASAVELTLAAGASRTLSARELEQGAQGLRGALGGGTGKWRLSVASSADIQAISLLLARSTGHLTNLSTQPLPSSTPTKEETTVDIADEILRGAVEGALGKDAGAPITRAEMAALVLLVARSGDIADLAGLEFATGLQTLQAQDGRIADLSPLADLASLSYLSLQGNQIADIGLLSGLVNLSRLFLARNRIVELEPLGGLTNLEWLYLQENDIVDLVPLAGLADLRGLFLNRNQVADLEPLAGLTKLQSLHLQENRIADISPVAGLTALEWLDLAENGIGDIAPLAGLTELGWLDLDNNEIVDIAPLANLTKLRSWLDFDHNHVEDVSPLAGLTNLEGLDFVHNQVVDISPLAGLTKLTYLAASENKIQNIGALAGLAQLQVLRLSRNRIGDVAPLAGLSNLETLQFYENEVSDMAPLEELTRLSTLHAQDNEIVDIGPLVDNTGIGEGDEVRLERNPLSEESCAEHVPALVARGAEVNNDCGG